MKLACMKHFDRLRTLTWTEEIAVLPAIYSHHGYLYYNNDVCHDAKENNGHNS